MADLRLVVEDLELEATWSDDSPETRGALEDALPVSGTATRWGDELYFEIPVDVDLETETARAEVSEGALAYWPTGNALCLFWGPTPASVDDEPRAASPVNVVGQVTDSSRLEALDERGTIEGGARIRLKSGEYVE